MINYSLSSDIDDEKILNDVISKMHCGEKRTVFEKCKNYILSDYKTYKESAGKLHLIKPDSRISAESGQHLKDAYKSNPIDLLRLKIQIKKSLPPALKARCPYCMISAHNTFDHYFSKDLYPEYAIFSYNLIPSCSECNSLKGTLLFDENGERLFLHFLFDEIPEYPFLKYELCVENKRIVLKKISLVFSENGATKSQIINHFSKLHIIPRLMDEYDVLASTIIDEFKNTGKGKEEIKQLVSRRLSALEKNYGKNYWEACFLRAIKDNREVVEFLAEA